MNSKSRVGRKGEAYTVLANSQVPLKSRVDFGCGSRLRTGNILKQLTKSEKVLLLSQVSLPRKWHDQLIHSLESNHFKVISHSLPDGEEAKSLERLNECWRLLEQHSFGRKDSILALGGGALSDLAGFCASTYLRGIKLVLLPTTLLAQVDASIGGKTAINLDCGKNLAGSFYFPDSVIVDPEFLLTLPERELKSGMGEIVKYAFIEETVAENAEYKKGPRSLITTIKNNFASGLDADNPFMPALIAICIRMKLAVVLKDPFEERLRRCLNLGHTLAHGLEKISNYEISHGEAVSIGTVFAFKLAADKGFIENSETETVYEISKSLGLPVEIPSGLDAGELTKVVAYDKKRSASKIKYVLPEKSAGRVNLDTEIEMSEIQEFIKKHV